MPPPRIRPADREDLLRHLRLCYWRTLNRLDGELEGTSLTARQFLLLKALADTGPMHARAICEELLVTPADVTGLAGRLERKQFVRRIRSLEDRRRVILEITPQGQKALLKARRQRDRLIDAMIHSLPAREFRLTMQGLGKLLGALEKIESSREPTVGASAPDETV